MDGITISCLGSGSGGNCYALTYKGDTVLIECGFPHRELISKLIREGIDPSTVKALLVSHRHGDHAKALDYLVGNGIPTYGPKELSDLPNYHSWQVGKRESPTDWLKVIPFEVDHDVECYGFVLFCQPTGESILFITDTRFFDFPYKSYRYDYLLLECNHVRKQLEAASDKALKEGNEGRLFKYRRQAAFHMSLAALKKLLNSMPRVKEAKAIVLIHLSRDMCNDVLVKEEIANVYGVRTLVAHAEGGLN